MIFLSLLFFVVCTRQWLVGWFLSVNYSTLHAMTLSVSTIRHSRSQVAYLPTRVWNFSFHVVAADVRSRRRLHTTVSLFVIFLLFQMGVCMRLYVCCVI